MKILVFSKRQYMGKDLLDDRFGRFRELPLGLARSGHEVHGIALSYRERAEGVFFDSAGSRTAGVTWHSVNLTNRGIPKLGSFVRRAKEIAVAFKPDVLWAGSDAYHVIFGSWLARRLSIPCVLDLYDNFEAFGASRVPFVLSWFRQAVRDADGLTCFSQRLSEHVRDYYSRARPTIAIENGVRKDLFRPLDRGACRKRLGLPQDATIIGTAGALEPARGIDTLFAAFELLNREGLDLHLAIAGPRRTGLRIPAGPKVRDFKVLRHEEVPYLLNALDVAVVCYRRSAQGEVSLPQKAYEILACRIPIVAAAVGSMIEILRDYPQCLYEPDRAPSLAATIRRQLHCRAKLNIHLPSWSESAEALQFFLETVVASVHRSQYPETTARG